MSRSKGPSRRGPAKATPAPKPRTASARKDTAADVKHALGQLADDTVTGKAADAEAVERPPTLAPVKPGEDINEQHLLAAYDIFRQWVEFYETCANRANTRQAEATSSVDSITRQRTDLDRELADASTDRARAAQLLADARDVEHRLDEREARVHEAERQADNGFKDRAAQAHAALTAELETRRQQATSDLQAAEAALREDVKLRLGRLAHDRAEFEAETARQQAAIDKLREQVHGADTGLGRKRAELHGLEVALNSREAQLDAEVDARAAVEIGDLERQLHLAQVNADADQRMVSDLTAQLERQNGILVKLGTDDPGSVLGELDKIKLENRDLKDKLAARMDDDTLDRLRWLEDQNRDLNAERERLNHELQELRGTLLANRINNLQVTQLAEAERHFDALTRGYETRIRELRTTLDDLNRDRPDPTAPMFPNCVNMDDDQDLNEPAVLVDEPPDLADLARGLQRAMFIRSHRKYRLNDVCFVLGGMAMSNLHLLQGMSGIGKTSLPKALAEALGTACSVIEVQAGWRDRTDLFGNHNTFDRTFEETQFLLALYRAHTPRYRHRPYFIVLDEMNLSRPEQYFSVILSKLENNDGEPIRLVPTGLGRRPGNMSPDGTGIAVPPNVWFVGTANHDESTLEFADKTYNRSFVLELPAKRPFVPRHPGKVEPYTQKALRIAFAAARNGSPEVVEVAKKFITALSPDLRDHGEIEIAPRVQDQLEAYVPVVVAAGAGIHDEENLPDEGGMDGLGLAIDQFLATKVLRQIHGKFEVNADRVRRLEERFLRHWEQAHLAGIPLESSRLLTREALRRDG